MKRLKKTGQLLIIFALTWMIFAGGLLSVYNVGTLVGERMRLQTAADSSAYSAAVLEARMLNYFAYTNRTIIAELSFMGYLCALSSCLEAWKTICEIASALPYVGPIFAAIAEIITAIEEILNVILEAPWHLLPQAIGELQSAIEIFFMWQREQLMKQVGNIDPAGGNQIQINSGGEEIVNEMNHNAIRKKGEWEALKEVLEATISPYTKGEFNGKIPIYNRDFYISIPIVDLLAFKVELRLGVYGDCDINKDRIRTEDGPGGGVYVGYWDPCEGEWDWSTLADFQLGLFSQEIDINLDQINFYVYDDQGSDKSRSVGLYSTAIKPKENLSTILFTQILDLFGAPQKSLTAVAKARTCYVDPVNSSQRHQVLQNDKEPNLFNPFWVAELVSLDYKEAEDANYGTTQSLIFDVFETNEHLIRH